MALTPTLNTVEALFRKMERELVRAHHHPNRIHKSDHFFNFCITANSLKDYFLERFGKVHAADQSPLLEIWADIPVLVAVGDIANSAKHFQLRDPRSRSPRTPRTKTVRPGKHSGADMFVDSDGDFYVVKRTDFPTIFVTLEDGSRFEMYAFMNEVTSYWRDQLEDVGIYVRRQSHEVLYGEKST